MLLLRNTALFTLVALLSGCAGDGQFSATQALTAGAGILQATTLSEEAVRDAARRAAEELDQQAEIAPASDPRSSRLARLAQALERIEGVELNYKVYLTDELNAFALPDGSIRVFSGLMDVMPDDQLLAVLNHEVGHVRLKHSYEQMRQRILTNAAFQTLIAGGGTLADLTASQLGQVAYAFINARFSQGDEIEADQYSVRALQRQGQDPAAMRRAIITLQEKAGGGGGFLSTHPSNARRLEAIDTALKKIGAGS